MPDFVDIPINATAEELEAVARMGTAPADDKTYGRKNGEWVEVINSVEQDYNPDSANAQSGVAVASAISTKQDVIDSNHKLSYSLLSGTPTIPTKTSDLTNDSGYITNAVNNLVNYYLKSETYTKTEVDSLISAISTISLQVVQTLPTEDIQTNVIYLVPRSDSETGNIYDEYIYVSNAWEKIGSTDVDLTGYATETWVNTQIDIALIDYYDKSVIDTALSVTEDLSNKVTSISSRSTDTQYPSAKCVYDGLANKVDKEAGKGLFSGSYTDLTNKPTIPTVDQTYDGTSANAQSGTAVAGALETKLTEPSSNLAVGKYFRIASIDENGHAVLECVDPPTAPVQSVSAAGTALPPDANGNVNISKAKMNNSNERVFGVIAPILNVGIRWGYGGEGLITLEEPTENSINNRTRPWHSNFGAINTKNYDYAVKAAMTDGIGEAWTDTERLAALLRMGCTVDENGFVKWTATPSE